MAVYPELVKSTSAAENRVSAQLAPQLERAQWQAEARIESEARFLMARNPRLCYGEARSLARGDDFRELGGAAVVNGSAQPAADPRLVLYRKELDAYHERILEQNKRNPGNPKDPRVEQEMG